jgi:hypothetical protein
MSDDDQKQTEYNEDGPGINGDLGSWLYVLGGIPMMITFFVVLFGLVGACDGQNVMIHG